MSELECLLLADDLTGACDAGVQFTRRGMATSVMLAMDAPPAGARVVAVSTESRHLPEAEAAAAVTLMADWLTARVIFKKIDSVLRGNPGAEIAAALAAFGCEAAVATPAFPAMGRINGAEVAAVLKSDVHVAANGVAAALASGARVVSADAVCDADLDAIVAGGWDRRVLWAGSGGLAGALARRMGLRIGGACLPCGHGSPTQARSSAPPVICIGSEHEVTLRQVQELKKVRPESVVIPPGPIPECSALVLSGGDTASAVCREAGARRIDLRDEVLPGIPWGILRCGRFDGMPVVTKSGGFGAPDALVRVAEFLA